MSTAPAKTTGLLGTEWLKTMPAHWETVPVWILFNIGRGRVISHLEIQENSGSYPVYSSQTESEGVMGSIDTFDFDGDYLTWTTDGAKAGTMFHRGGKFNCTNVCGTLQAKKPQTYLRFYLYALSIATPGYVRPDINPKLMNDDMAYIRVPTPPLPEQQAIAAFLDRKTAEIDRLLRLKEQQIELLEKKRQATISEAVTGGLDFNAPMQSTGIDGMESIPAHWQPVRLKYLIRYIEQGWSPQCENRLSEENEWGVLKVGCVNGKQFNAQEHKALPFDLAPRPEYEVKTGDVLMSRANTKSLLGSASVVGQVRPRLLLCDKLYRLVVNPSLINPQYLVTFLRSAWVRTQFEQDATGSSDSMQNIGQDTVKNIIVPLPPLSEQAMLLVALRGHSAQVDCMVDVIQGQIVKLKAYRQSLISEAVTGKIDVRGLDA